MRSSAKTAPGWTFAAGGAAGRCKKSLVWPHLIAEAGFRVLLHDRRNTGLSSVSIDGEGSEFEIWAEDLSGAPWPPWYRPRSRRSVHHRDAAVSTILALRRPTLVNALVMMRVTGGAFAVKRLSDRYYTKLIAAAQKGGMAAVCEDADFSSVIKRTPSRRQELLGLGTPIVSYLSCRSGRQTWRRIWTIRSSVPP